jgi:hypothetical protein
MTPTNYNPEDEAVSSGLRQALLEIHTFRTKNPTARAEQKTIQTLIGIGALSPPSAAFVESHHARFHGFPQRIAPGIEVLDIVLGDRRFIGFADGHVELVAGELAKG